MTQDEIIEMARQATDNESIYCRQEFTFSAKQLQAFANLVAAKEREACAKVCEEHPDGMNILGGAYIACAKAIRDRGEQA